MRLGGTIAATAFEAVARTFGESVRIEPLVSSEYAAAAADPDRAIATVRATVALSPATDGLEGRRRGSEMQGFTRLALRDARIWFSPADYAGIGYGLRSGDRVVLVERPGEPPYLVAREPVASDRGDVSVDLTLEGSA